MISIQPDPSAGSFDLLRLLRWLGCLLCFYAFPGQSQPQQSPPGVVQAEQAAMQVMDNFMQAFNARDMHAWAATLHYPHVRIAAGKVTVYPDAKAFVAGRDLDEFARKTGWHHSAWDDRQIIQSSLNKVHIAVRFSRYRADGEKYASYDSLYILQKRDGRWGIVARSSFAP